MQESLINVLQRSLFARIRPAMNARPILFAAPHRLAFLVGSANLLLLAAWWLLSLVALHAGPALLQAGTMPAGWLHGPAMLNLIFPPFVFGFLLTVFPRWMGYPDLPPRSFGTVSVLLAVASAIAQFGLWTAQVPVFAAGLAVEAAGWLAGIAVLARVTWQNGMAGKPRCWHAWSALLALLLGDCATGLAALAMCRSDAGLAAAAVRLSIAGFLVPVFLTVAHRMVPFFAANVVQAYVRWRPDWLLAAIWGLLLAGLLAALAELPLLVVAGHAGLAGLCVLMLWKWWPRGAAPGLLRVLFWGLAWTPVAFCLQALAPLYPQLGRAPDHAVLIGFCASMLIAMVTRVTHGHSGRPLEMSRTAWLAFAAMQLTAVLRVVAALRFEPGGVLVLTGIAFLAGLAPWCLGNITIYLRPRRDGRPG